MENYEVLKNNVIAAFCTEYIDGRKLDQFMGYRYKKEDYKIFYNDDMAEVALNDELVNDEFFEVDTLIPIINDITGDLYNDYITGENIVFIAYDLLERYISIFHMDDMAEDDINYVYTTVKNSSLIFYEVMRHKQNYSGLISESTFVGYTDAAGRDKINKYGYHKDFLIGYSHDEALSKI